MVELRQFIQYVFNKSDSENVLAGTLVAESWADLKLLDAETEPTGILFVESSRLGWLCSNYMWHEAKTSFLLRLIV